MNLFILPPPPPKKNKCSKTSHFNFAEPVRPSAEIRGGSSIEVTELPSLARVKVRVQSEYKKASARTVLTIQEYQYDYRLTTISIGKQVSNLFYSTSQNIIYRDTSIILRTKNLHHICSPGRVSKYTVQTNLGKCTSHNTTRPGRSTYPGVDISPSVGTTSTEQKGRYQSEFVDVGNCFLVLSGRYKIRGLAFSLHFWSL